MYLYISDTSVLTFLHRPEGQQPEEGGEEDEEEEEEEALWSSLPPVDVSKDHLDFFGQYVR